MSQICENCDRFDSVESNMSQICENCDRFDSYLIPLVTVMGSEADQWST